jgi:hypothetical protein
MTIITVERVSAQSYAQFPNSFSFKIDPSLKAMRTELKLILVDRAEFQCDDCAYFGSHRALVRYC